MKESIETKPRLEKDTLEDSDDEILARRLEYFSKSASCTRASMNKSERSNFSKPNKRKKSTMDVMTSWNKIRRGKEIIMDSQKTLSKGTKSFSGLNALTTHLYDQGECSLEDTCRSPKTLCLESHVEEKDEGSCQVILTNFEPHNENEKELHSKSSNFSISKCTLNDSLEVHVEDNMSLDEDPDSRNLLDFQCEINEWEVKECDCNSNHIAIHNGEDDRLNAKVEDIAIEDDIVLLQSGEMKLDSPTSIPQESHG